MLIDYTVEARRCLIVDAVFVLNVPRRLDTQRMSVGRAGGSFDLEFGGVMTVPPEAVSKRTTVTCARVPGHQRYRFEPTLRQAFI